MANKAEDNTAKHNFVLRLTTIVDNLERQEFYRREAQALRGVLRAVKHVSRDATMQELVTRTLATVVDRDATLDGRMVDTLAHLAVKYKVPLEMHPGLLLVASFGGQDNPDRADPTKSRTLDALLSTVLEERANYQRGLYVIATLARQHGLDATADRALALLAKASAPAPTESPAQAQAQVVTTALAVPPPVPQGDELGWVVKLMLTLGTVAAMAAMFDRLAGGSKFTDLLETVESVLGSFGAGARGEER